MRRLLDAFRAHPVLTPLFVLAAALTVMFAVRTVVFTLYWADPAHQDQPLEPWMTPRYVAHSWDLPPEVIIRALGVESGQGRRVSLAELARQQGIDVDELEARLRKAAREWRAAHPEAGDGADS